jgi:hypothetical protein
MSISGLRQPAVRAARTSGYDPPAPMHLLLALLLAAHAGTPASGDAAADHVLKRARAGIPLNALVLDEIARLPHDGSLPYAWTRGVHTDGVSRPVVWNGAVLAIPDETPGVHCSGVTFEVYVRALARALETRPDAGPGPTAATLQALKEAWYVRDGFDGGPAEALVRLGLGEPVSHLADLRPGDFVQFWRNNGNGHSAVFVDHTRTRSGGLRGMVFWSAQASSEGPGRRYVSEGRAIHQITPGRLYGVRAVVPTR